MKPRFQCVVTQWMSGFRASGRRTEAVPVWLKSDLWSSRMNAATPHPKTASTRTA